MTPEETAIQQTVRQVVSDALQLPCREATNLLRGLLVLGGDHEALEPVRDAYEKLRASENQLELIASEEIHKG